METDTKKNVYIYMHVLKTKTKSGVIDVRLVWYPVLGWVRISLGYT